MGLRSMMAVVTKAIEIQNSLGIKAAAGYLRNRKVHVENAQDILVRRKREFERMIAIARALQ
jgi:hypothetical protein